MTDRQQDGRTDGQTDTARRQRSRSCIASRGTIGIFDQYLASSRVVKVSPSKFENMITRLDTIHERGRQQDGRTDRHRTTAKVAFMHRITRQKSVFRRISCFIACCKCATVRFLPLEVMYRHECYVSPGVSAARESADYVKTNAYVGDSLTHQLLLTIWHMLATLRLQLAEYCVTFERW